MNKELESLIFPEELLNIFEVVSYDKTMKGHVLYLDENANIPGAYDRSDLGSKGTYLFNLSFGRASCTIKIDQ